uniref:Uncharacterized protein n=1 Tax=Arundo donax TaxID=35708 RepID=A0A0A9AI96_ARUDO
MMQCQLSVVYVNSQQSGKATYIHAQVGMFDYFGSEC